MARAAALAARGRSEAALAALAGASSPGARVLAIRCQLELGRLGAARAALRGCEEMPLAPGELAELAEIASRVYASHGKPGRAGYWIRRALDETGGDPGASLLARLAAAGAAWDRGDGEALERFLEAARGALDDPGLAWRWRQLRALQAGGEGDPGGGGGRGGAGHPRRPAAADPASGGGAVERPRLRPRPARRPRRGRAGLPPRGASGGGLRRPPQVDPRPLQRGRDPGAPGADGRRARDRRPLGEREPPLRQPARLRSGRRAVGPLRDGPGAAGGGPRRLPRRAG